MNTIPTAEEIFFRNTGKNINQEESSAMIEFAKLHVEAMLLEILSKITILEDGIPVGIEKIWYAYNTSNVDICFSINIEELKKIYPIDNIK